MKKVYQFVSSPKDTAYVEQRKALAAAFQLKYGADAERYAANLETVNTHEDTHDVDALILSRAITEFRPLHGRPEKAALAAIDHRGLEY